MGGASGLISVAWTYASKLGDTQIPAGGFVGGGINLTAIGLGGCFSSFVAETRSSPSITATLKDFVVGNFEVCDSAGRSSRHAVPVGRRSIQITA